MKFMKTLSTRVLPTAILAAASFAAHASGADEQGAIVVRVRYDDLNLSAPAGVASLKRRVSSAAAQVCADQYDSNLVGRSLRQSCIRRTTDIALAQVKWPEK
jgi:UrcA family protein